MTDIRRGTGGILGEVSDVKQEVADLDAKTATVISTTAPGINDDVTKGYILGNHWINTVSDTVYVLVDNTAGSAVWNSLGSGGGGPVSFQASYDGGNAFSSSDGGLSGDGSIQLTATANLAAALQIDTASNANTPTAIELHSPTAAGTHTLIDLWAGAGFSGAGTHLGSINAFRGAFDAIEIIGANSAAGTATNIFTTGGETATGTGGDNVITGGLASGLGAAGSVNIAGGEASAGGTAGSVILTGGSDGTYTGGAITLTGAADGTVDVTTSNSPSPGQIGLTAGNATAGAATGAAVVLTSGDGANPAGTGGAFTFETGEGFTTGAGGDFALTLGAGGTGGGAGRGGDFNVTGGTAADTGRGGNVVLTGGDSTAGVGGEVTLVPGNGVGGDGAVVISSASTGAPADLRFVETDGAGGEYVGLKAPAAVGASIVWALPAADGVDGNAILTDGAGNLRFDSARDANSVHLDTANEFNTVALKSPIVGDDLLLIESSTDGGAKRYTTANDVLAPGEVTVFSVDELPAPVGGIITLDADTVYRFIDTVDIGTNRIDFGAGTSVLMNGNFSEHCSITSSNATGTVTATATTSAVVIRDLTIANTGGGYALRVDDTSRADFADVRTTSGRIEIVNVPDVIIDSCLFLDRLVFTGSVNGGVAIDASGFLTGTAATAAVDITATGSVGAFTARTSGFISTNVGAFGLRIDPAGTVSRGTVDNGVFGFVGTALSGLTAGDDEWVFTNTSGVLGFADSLDQASASWQGTATVIDLPIAQAWVPVGDAGVNITYSLDSGAQKFTLTDVNDGVVTYNGVRVKGYKLQAAVTLRRDTAPDIRVQVGIAINGTIVDRTAQTTTAFADYTAVTTVLNVATLNPGDTVQVVVRNIDVGNPGDDIEIIAASLSVVG